MPAHEPAPANTTDREDDAMKIEMLNVGWLTAPAAVMREGDDPQRTIRLPVPAYLIETPSERILIDTGLNPAAIADPGGYYERPDTFGLFGIEQDQSVAEQIDVNTLTKVVLTHLHWDHVGGLQLIPQSVPIVIQRGEWQAGHADATVQRNFFCPRDYADDGREAILLDGDCDLLGDGSIELLLTPGHTPGHQSVRIGDLLLGADVAHFAGALDDHRFPVFGHDRDEQKRSAERLRGLRDDGLRFIPGHDPDVLRPGPLHLPR
jgi:N-acyl homoserine lactone hydrolase